MLSDDQVPAVARTDGGLALVGAWIMSGAEHQRRAADAAMRAWRDAWPDGLRAHSCLLGEDGRTVLHYIQWSGVEACRAFIRAGRPRWIRTVDDAVPGIAHQGVTAYRLYRSTTPGAGAPPTGCLVTVTVDFDGPDERRQRAWVDGVFDAAGTSDASPVAGMLAAHFHVSVDGTRVLNLAEWTTAEAHRDAATTAHPVRTAVQQFPGVTGTTVGRYAPYRTCASP